jgi:hypothetical protein
MTEAEKAWRACAIDGEGFISIEPIQKPAGGSASLKSAWSTRTSASSTKLPDSWTVTSA